VLREDRDDGTILLRSGYFLSEVADTSAVWLRRWATERADTVFLAERSGAGWRAVTFGAALQQVRSLAAGLLARGLGPDTPLLILSGNGIDHGLLTLAAHHVGIPTVPVAEQYSLIPGAQTQLQHILGLIDPALVFAGDGLRFADALNLPEMQGRQIIVAENPGPGMDLLETLHRETAEVDSAAARVGPDSVVKILMTSGSTSAPKGVLTTHRMMCANQAMIADALPFVQHRPPRIVDWLPWNHVFGGSHNFNLMLANGGTLYIDAGKPARPLIAPSIENNRLISATMAFNVPVGFALMRNAMRDDKALRESYFRDLDMLFYAGASLPQDVWQDLADMARDVRGDVPLMTSCWGLTETAPACLIQHEPTDRSGVVGVPMTGNSIKLVPEEDGRFEVRVKGPNVMPGYFNAPEQTAAAFDEEGYFRSGDAMSFLDPEDMARGLKFDGRISEDFKLMTGTWVRAAALRLDVLVALAPLAADVIVTGEARQEVGLLILPAPDAAGPGSRAEAGALVAPDLAAAITRRLDPLVARATGSSNRITRALILAEPASIAEGEVTAKGNLNFRRLLDRRAALLDRLYDDTDPATIRL
jgi:feruloyl-CoA synthase